MQSPKATASRIRPFMRALGFQLIGRTDRNDDGRRIFPAPHKKQDVPQDRSSSQASIRTAYDILSEAYAEKFIDELNHKPLDRELLKQFAALVGTERMVLDVGCDPGHTTAHLTSLGLVATGVDLSPQMIESATAAFPQSCFVVGDFFGLPNESSSTAGIFAFYCIVDQS